MTDIEKLQKYLPLIRSAAGWTAADLGNKIGVTKQTISNLENQKNKMSKTQYLAIQMVISQKIASSPEDTKLAEVMKLVMNTEEEPVINYDAVPNAIAAAEQLEKECAASDVSVDDSAVYRTYDTNDISKTVAGAATGATIGGVAGALGMLGLGPVGAISAAVLGATVAPWLKKALDEDQEEKK